MMWMHGSHAMSWAGWLFMIGFWVLVLLGLVSLLRVFGQGQGPKGTDTSRAEEILEERFSRGEISVEEFRQMRDELRSVRSK